MSTGNYGIPLTSEDVRVIIDRCGRHASSLGSFFVGGRGQQNSDQ